MSPDVISARLIHERFLSDPTIKTKMDLTAKFFNNRTAFTRLENLSTHRATLYKEAYDVLYDDMFLTEDEFHYSMRLIDRSIKKLLRIGGYE